MHQHDLHSGDRCGVARGGTETDANCYPSWLCDLFMHRPREETVTWHEFCCQRHPVGNDHMFLTHEVGSMPFAGKMESQEVDGYDPMLHQP